MKCCGVQTNDFSYRRKTILEQTVPYFYCAKCGTHYFDGKTYTPENWFFYINGVTYDDYAQQNQDQDTIERSIHAYEMINNHLR